MNALFPPPFWEQPFGGGGRRSGRRDVAHLDEMAELYLVAARLAAQRVQEAAEAGPDGPGDVDVEREIANFCRYSALVRSNVARADEIERGG